MDVSNKGLGELVFVDQPKGLKRLLDIINQEPMVAVDTESNSLHAYREQVCLIQFSTPTTDYLLDPLAVSDLSALGPFFANPEIEKVFHAAEYDLICLRRDFNFSFARLFDTMVAASLLGRPEIGLGALLESEFSIEVDKRYQRADWGQRPLPPELLAYARMDTHFLIPLRNQLKIELVENERWAMAEEDFSRIARMAQAAVNGNKDGDPVASTCWRITGVYDLDPQQAAVLLELCRYRDHAARQSNRPLFKVINDATLLAIAVALPMNINELKDLPGMTQGQIRRHGHQILQAVHRGLDAKPVTPPRPQRPDEQFLARLEALRKWRKQAAQKLEVKSDMVLARDLLYSIALHNPHNLDELTTIMKDSPWRLEHYGQQILAAIHK